MDAFYLIVVAVIFFTALKITDDGLEAFIITVVIIWLAPDIKVDVNTTTEVKSQVSDNQVITTITEKSKPELTNE